MIVIGTIAGFIGGAVIPLCISVYLLYDALTILMQPGVVYFSLIGVVIVTLHRKEGCTTR
jgi:uncharacterized membrane protein